MKFLQDNTWEEAFDAFWEHLPYEKKAGFLVWPSLAGPEVLKEECALLELYSPAGFILFKRNFASLEQAARLIKRLRACVPEQGRVFPPVVAIDEEGGRVSRLPPPFVRGKPALELADAGDEDSLRSQVLHQAFVARGLGIDMILAPVADILTEPANPVMGDRCFGRDADSVSKYAGIVWDVLREQGLFACAKHFPGHGNTRSDSHKEFAMSDVSLATLESREWLPFRSLINAGIPFVMTAHVLVPALDPVRPATLSPEILQKHLRKNLGFDGIIMSDDLRMNAIAEYYRVRRGIDSSITESHFSAQNAGVEAENPDRHLPQAAIDALKAGCDVLCSCQSIVRERPLLQAVADEMRRDAAFDQDCRTKACRLAKALFLRGREE